MKIKSTFRIKIKTWDKIKATFTQQESPRCLGSIHSGKDIAYFDPSMLALCGQVFDAAETDYTPYGAINEDSDGKGWFWHESWYDVVPDLSAQTEDTWNPLKEPSAESIERKQIAHEAFKLFRKQMYKAELNLQKLGSVGFQVDWANVERRKALVDQMIEETKCSDSK